MATRIELIEVTVPLQTLIAAPQTTDLEFPEGVVDNLEILIPPGPSGLVGFQVLHSGQQVIPITAGRFIVTDNETLDWPLSGYPVGHAWAVRAYNLDRYDHTLYFRFLVTDLGQEPIAAVAPVEILLPEAGPAAIGEAEELPELAGDELDELLSEEATP